jgi:hypothetical protein
MTRRFSPPQPLAATTTPAGDLVRVYRRRWLTVTCVLDRWHQHGLWWTEATTPDQAWLATERHYARIVLDERQVWDVFQTTEGCWYLERIVLH